MNEIIVEDFVIDDSRVTFSWIDNSFNNPFRKNNFYFDYDGISLLGTDRNILWSVFLSCFIPVIRSAYERAVIILPFNSQDDIVKPWIDFHNARNVNYIYAGKPLNSLTSTFKKIEQFNHGVLYGGGKDSLFTYNSIRDIHPVDKNNHVVISYIFPASSSFGDDIEKRREKFIFGPLRDVYSDCEIQFIKTDIRLSVRDEYLFAFHTGIYAGTCLPACLYHKLNFVTFSFEFTHFWTHTKEKKESPYFCTSRPESNNYISQHLSKLLGYNFKFYNFNYPISEYFAFKAIVKKYPKSLSALTMCEGTSSVHEKYCYKCTKCAEYILYNLSLGVVPTDFDIVRFFDSNTYIENIIKKIDNNEVDSVNKWYPGLTFVLHYMSFQHVLSKIDVKNLHGLIAEKHIDTLGKIISFYGKDHSKEIESLHVKLAYQEAPPKLQEYLRVLAKETCTNNDEKIHISYGNSDVIVDSCYELCMADIHNPLNYIDYHKYVKSQIDSSIKTEINSHLCQGTKNFENGTLNFKIIDSAPVKGSYCSLKVFVNKKDYPSDIIFNLENGYTNNNYRGIISYILLVDGIPLHEFDLCDWGNKESFKITVPKDKEFEFEIKIISRKNTQAWNWGNASELKIDLLQRVKSRMIHKGIALTTTYPLETTQ
ncbi:hypothetical protein [Aeromonas hydrophila]|uniref:hypothetical protein n=1 Tax=Aeromonas hydrophila TaxID=644 RepID=UPI002B47BBA0|nr:hypothetical protein [Aeromonas hydrophila]